MELNIDKNVFEINEGDNLYKVKYHELEYNFYLAYKNSDKLVILFNGAVDRNKSQLPVFQRKTWVKDINANCLIFDDPTLQANEKMSIGWYVGNSDENAQFYIKRIIKAILEVLKINSNKIIFYGSSAGGYMALIMSIHFPNTEVIVNNPQISILKYSKIHVDILLKNAFNNISRKEFLLKFENRIDITSLIKNSKRTPKVLYLQNIIDTEHYENHLMYFLNNISKIVINNFDYIDIKIYLDIKDKHNPLKKELTLKYINNHLLTMK